MTIKTILLPIRESKIADSLMETSISMAIRNDSHLDLLYVRNHPERMIPFATLGISAGMRRTIIESATESATKQGEDLKQRFLALCKKHGISVSPRGTELEKPSADFLIRDGLRDELIGKHGRIADLIIVPQPFRMPPPSSFEAALRETGRPILMVPRGKILVEKGKRLAIGWNSSKEAAQAISAVMNNLQKAEKVYVICSEKRMKQPINSDDVCVYLRCHGVTTAETALFDTKQQSPGEALLAKTRELNCDRLIVGGYSRAKIRAVIMGGVTGHLLEHADIPVIMVH